MLLRGKSKDRSRKTTPPGPSYMSNEQFAEYLAKLRNNRVARPTGARPPALTNGHGSADRGHVSPKPPTEDVLFPQSENAPSDCKAQPVFPSVNSRLGRSLVQSPYTVTPLKPSIVVPRATYIERGQRWMEKEEACALRDALDDMDLQKEREEANLHAAAQEEASELVWKHQHPEAIRPDGIHKYKAHLRKNSYAQARIASIRGYSGAEVTGLARDIVQHRSVSGRSTDGSEMLSQRTRVSSVASSVQLHSCHKGPESEIHPPVRDKPDIKPLILSQDIPIGRKPMKTYPGLSNMGSPSGYRRSSGKRNISGEPLGSFTPDQIWEEPGAADPNRGQPPGTREGVTSLRFTPPNPTNEVQNIEKLHPRLSSTVPEPVKRNSPYEIHKNPPSQSRNPHYTANPSPVAIADTQAPFTSNDGLEIRGEDIRQATSMKLKDRSPKLPTPAFVSDKPGRPIVSFDASWKPNKEGDLKPVETPRGPRLGQKSHSPGQSKSFPALLPPQIRPPVSVPAIAFPDQPPLPVDSISETVHTTICAAVDLPTINVPDVPKVSTHNSPQIFVSEPSPKPVVSVPTPTSQTSRSSRPLPDPKNNPFRPTTSQNVPTTSKNHWSPVAKNRATATCHQCQLPIEGRVVALNGTPERFHPECFICYTCGTGLEALEISPEPAEKRAERLSRIQRRIQGEYVEGGTEADDGDERLRFYCHLDWHELFAPRCKHCRTPIIGEHAVAVGAHWHYGHFFCAECGDPFEQGMTHIEKDGYAWCLACQTKRTERQAPKCRKCQLPVIGQYVQAMGGEYHNDCFRCAMCSGGFDDGQIFPTTREGNGETVVLCTGCMERELKA